MARVIGQNQQTRLTQGTLGTSDVLNAHLRAQAENIAHPIDTGQASTTPAATPDVSAVTDTRPVSASPEDVGAIPDDTRTQASAGAAGGDRTRPTGRIAV